MTAAGAALVALSAACLLRELGGKLAPFITLFGILLLYFAFGERLARLLPLFSSAADSSLFTLTLKIAGVFFLCRLLSEVSRHLGEARLADAIDLLGEGEILLLLLPTIEELFTLGRELEALWG